MNNKQSHDFNNIKIDSNIFYNFLTLLEDARVDDDKSNEMLKVLKKNVSDIGNDSLIFAVNLSVPQYFYDRLSHMTKDDVEKLHIRMSTMVDRINILMDKSDDDQCRQVLEAIAVFIYTQLQFLKGLLSVYIINENISNVESKLDKIRKKTKKITRDFIVILGVFAAIFMAFDSGLKIELEGLRNISDQTKISVLTLIAIFTMSLLLSFYNFVLGLDNYDLMNKISIKEKICNYCLNLLKPVNIIGLSFIIVLVCFYNKLQINVTQGELIHEAIDQKEENKRENVEINMDTVQKTVAKQNDVKNDK